MFAEWSLSRAIEDGNEEFTDFCFPKQVQSFTSRQKILGFCLAFVTKEFIFAILVVDVHLLRDCL